MRRKLLFPITALVVVAISSCSGGPKGFDPTVLCTPMKPRSQIKAFTRDDDFQVAGDLAASCIQEAAYRLSRAPGSTEMVAATVVDNCESDIFLFASALRASAVKGGDPETYGSFEHILADQHANFAVEGRVRVLEARAGECWRLVQRVPLAAKR